MVADKEGTALVPATPKPMPSPTLDDADEKCPGFRNAFTQREGSRVAENIWRLRAAFGSYADSFTVFFLAVVSSAAVATALTATPYAGALAIATATASVANVIFRPGRKALKARERARMWSDCVHAWDKVAKARLTRAADADVLQECAETLTRETAATCNAAIVLNVERRFVAWRLRARARVLEKHAKALWSRHS